MAWGRRIKSEHSGAKQGRGYWGRKAEAKQAGKWARRRQDRLSADSWTQDDSR